MIDVDPMRTGNRQRPRVHVPKVWQARNQNHGWIPDGQEHTCPRRIRDTPSGSARKTKQPSPASFQLQHLQLRTGGVIANACDHCQKGVSNERNAVWSWTSLKYPVGFKRLGVHPRQAGRSAICHQNAPVSCNNPCCFRKAVACGDMAEGAMVDHVQTVPRGMRHKYALCLGFKGSVIECAAIRTGDFYGSYGAEGHSGLRCWYRTFGTLRTGLEHWV